MRTSAKSVVLTTMTMSTNMLGLDATMTVADGSTIGVLALTGSQVHAKSSFAIIVKRGFF